MIDIFFIIFTWAVIFLIIHTWVLYPAAMIIADRVGLFDPQSQVMSDFMPPISVIIPVFNGEDKVCDKIMNILESDYPSDCIEIIVVSDGSTDSTVWQVNAMRCPQVVVIDSSDRLGKSGAQNMGFNLSHHQYVVFTDVDAKLAPDALCKMMCEFSDMDVGCVGAMVSYNSAGYESSSSHGLYWQIEQRLKMAQSNAGILVSLCGSLFAVRRNIFKTLDIDTGDDFIIPLDAVIQGYRNKLSITALAYDEWPSSDHLSELRTRRRITMRNFLGLFRRIGAISLYRQPGVLFGLVSHKVLRWLSPLFMLVALVCSAVYASLTVIGLAVFVIQLTFYLVAVVGLVFNLRGRHVAILSTFGAFMWSNIGMLLGLIALVSGQRVRAYRYSESPSQSK